MSNELFQIGLGGGARRDRTADLLHAMQALSQLSYSPKQSRQLYIIKFISFTSR